MNFVLTNIEVFVVIVLLNKPKGTNTENYLREFKAARTSLAKLECANLKLNENEYTTRILIQVRYTIHGFETPNLIFYDTLSQEAGSAVVILNSVSIHVMPHKKNYLFCVPARPDKSPRPPIFKLFFFKSVRV
jgi:hypothetical protein